MNPYDAAHLLAKALRESPEFKEYGEAQKLISGDSAACEMLADFRREQFRLQKQELSGLEIAPEQIKKLENLFEVLNLNLTVKRFLDAEFRMSRLIADIQNIIGEATTDLLDPALLQQLGGLSGNEDNDEQEQT